MYRRNATIFLIVVTPLLLLVGMLAGATMEAESVYGTFLGGALTERGYSIVVDEQGRATVAGHTTSLTPTLPMAGAHGVDVIAVRLNSDATDVDYFLWLNAVSALAEDYGYGVAVGPDDSAYVVGLTQSEDFCGTLGSVPGIDRSYNGSGDAFLMKVKPDGGGLDYCTYLGGNDIDTAHAVALDEDGYVYVAGSTWSTDFITGTTTLGDENHGLRDIFLVRINPEGTAIVHSSYLGGSGQEEARGMTVGPAGIVTLAGWTNSGDLPTTPGVIGPEYSGGFDAFVIKVDTVTPDLLYATYIGGTDEDRGYALAGDEAGNTVVAGATLSSDFPTTPGSYLEAPAGGRDGFVVKLNADATALRYGTYLGGRGVEEMNAVALDLAGNAHLTGFTDSTDFPTSTDALSATLPGPKSALVAILNEPGSDLLYSSYLGGSADDIGYSIALGEVGRVYLAGATQSEDFPTSPDAYDTGHNGDFDVFVTSQLIPVFVPLEAEFLATPVEGPAPLAVQFANLSTGEIITTTWDFGDGSVSHVLEPLHLYESPGAYTVTLTIEGPAGSDSLTRPAYILVSDRELYLPIIIGP